MRHARLRAVVSGSHNARVRRQRPAVVDEPVQNDLEDDRLGLLCSIGQFVEEEYVELAVLTEALQLDEPHRLDVYDLVVGLVVDRAPVYGLRRLIDKLYIQHIRVYLLDTVALAVAGETVDEDRDVRLDEGSDEVELIMLFDVVGRPGHPRCQLFVVFS